jgi:hypothetical protein
VSGFATNLILLSEYEYGYSPARIGFPSISACRAILYQTTTGLFGFHQATGFGPNKIDRDADKFARFVTGHRAGAGSGLNLYVGAKIGAGSTYAQGLPGLQEMVAEIGAIARALRFDGPARVYDLSYNTPGAQGVYIEFDARTDSCDVFINNWVDHHDDSHKGAPRGSPGDHLYCHATKTEFTTPARVFLQADTAGQKQVEPIPIPLR